MSANNYFLNFSFSASGRLNNPNFKVDSTNLTSLIRINSINKVPKNNRQESIFKKKVLYYKSKLLLQSEAKDHADLSFIKFGDDIRSGSIENIENILTNQGIEILNALEILIEVSFRFQSTEKVETKQLDVLWLTPFHLAILGKLQGVSWQNDQFKRFINFVY